MGITDAGFERTRPQLLGTTGALLLSPVGWAMEVIAEAGFAGVEVLFAHNHETRDPVKLGEYAARAGLAIPAVHGPYQLMLSTVCGLNYVEKTRRSLALASEIGAETLVAHAPYRWQQKARQWLADEVEAEAAGHETRFAMENLYPVAGRAFSSAITPDELSEHRHVVLDTSHLGVAGIDLLEAWRRVGDRLVHIHLSDNYGHGRDNHAPLGEGRLPIAEFLAAVAASGYTGTITLEQDCRGHLDTRDQLVAFMAAERAKAEAMLAGEPQPASAGR
jgi:sugar phosphate isomerase/epimerase